MHDTRSSFCVAADQRLPQTATDNVQKSRLQLALPLLLRLSILGERRRLAVQQAQRPVERLLAIVAIRLHEHHVLIELGDGEVRQAFLLQSTAEGIFGTLHELQLLASRLLELLADLLWRVIRCRSKDILSKRFLAIQQDSFDEETGVCLCSEERDWGVCGEGRGVDIAILAREGCLRNIAPANGRRVS